VGNGEIVTVVLDRKGRAIRLPDFEVFDKAHVLARHVPTLTILRGRVLSLNHAAYTALDEPSAVELLFDRVKRIVGLRAIAASAPHACFVRSGARRAHGPFLVSAMAFLGHYEIDTTVTRRWHAWVEDAVLCVALDDEYEVVTGTRHRD
jgi:hypothetical protein